MRREFGSFITELHRYPVVSVDLETTGKHWYRDRAFGVAIGGLQVIHADGAPGEIDTTYVDLRDKPHAVEALKRELARCKLIVNHNIKFDAHFCREAGFELPVNVLQCTSTRAALINEHELSFGLDALGIKYAGMGKNNDVYEKLAGLFGGKPTRDAQILNLARAPVEIAAEYALDDPVVAIRLWLWQEQEIAKQNLSDVWNLERRLLPVLIDIERHGVRVDLKRTNSSIARIDAMIPQIQRELDALCGAPMNVNSAPQKRKLFGVAKREDGSWATASGYPLEKTDGGEGSLGQDVLRALAEQGDKRAELILKTSKLIKARSFLQNHILGHAVGDRVFPNYNTTRSESGLGTGTGRFSIDDPALQQIPARDVEIAEEVRSCFLPDKGMDWCCSDWQQFEFRWFSHYVNEPAIIRAYQEDPDRDFHALAAQITGLPRGARFAGDPNAKQINLGLVFGMGQGRLAAEMGLPYTVKTRGGREYLEPGPEAMEVFTKYHSAIPGVDTLLSTASSLAKSRGYVITMGGRHIRFPRGRFTHKAGGLVFQGTSADCMKIKMIELHDASKAEGFRLMLSVHDETDSSVPRGAKGKKAVAAIKEISERFDGETTPIKCRVPIRASVAVAPNWFLASK